MKDYSMICTYKHMKGFFKKKVAGEYLIVVFKDTTRDTVLLIQFFDKMGEFYLAGIVGGAQSPDDEVLEEMIDMLRHDSNVDVLEDKVPSKMKASAKGLDIQFTKPSKYLGKNMLLQNDSRLPEGYYLVKVIMKKGFEPAQQYKVGAGAVDLGDIKKMRAFTSGRMNAILSKFKRK